VRQPAPRTVVIGIGNPDRGDDAAGPQVLRRLRGRLPAHVELIEEGGESIALLDQLQGCEAAYLIDACRSGGPPGALRRIDARDCPLPPDSRECSTHGFGLAQALELGRALGLLPRRCVVYCIEGTSYDPGAPLSDPVRSAIDTLAARLIAEIGAGGSQQHVSAR
jgi:hydrogenase maturation protease